MEPLCCPKGSSASWGPLGWRGSPMCAGFIVTSPILVQGLTLGCLWPRLRLGLGPGSSLARPCGCRAWSVIIRPGAPGPVRGTPPPGQGSWAPLLPEGGGCSGAMNDPHPHAC